MDHLYNNFFAACIIYLNKNNNIDSGTTISKLTKDIDVFDYSIRDKMYHDRLEDIDKYKIRHINIKVCISIIQPRL